MALIKCPECGQQVSDRAKACIHCGCPLEEEKNIVKIKFNPYLNPNPYVGSVNMKVTITNEQTGAVIVKSEQAEILTLTLDNPMRLKFATGRFSGWKPAILDYTPCGPRKFNLTFVRDRICIQEVDVFDSDIR